MVKVVFGDWGIEVSLFIDGMNVIGFCSIVF